MQNLSYKLLHVLICASSFRFILFGHVKLQDALTTKRSTIFRGFGERFEQLRNDIAAFRTLSVRSPRNNLSVE